MSNPVVSVLMTTFNDSRFLAEAIDSILNQTFIEFELIIIDDGSSDGTWEIISEYARRDQRIVPIRNKSNLGTSRALNRGLKVARGRFITRQDGDDISLPERLAEQVNFLERMPGVGSVGTTAEIINELGENIDIFRVPIRDAEIQEILLDHMCFCGPTVMCERHLFERVGFYYDEDLSFSEDYDLCLRLAEVTEMANLQQVQYLYRRHASSVSQSKRYLQLMRKATALTNALQRRYGDAIPEEKLFLICRDHVRLAVLDFIAGNRDKAIEWLLRAVSINATLWNHIELFERVIRPHIPDEPDLGLIFVESIFDELLPKTKPFTRLKSLMLAELHMKCIFSSNSQTRQEQIRTHLWSGIQKDPKWLLNRGVCSMAVKHLFANVIFWRSPQYRTFTGNQSPACNGSNRET